MNEVPQLMFCRFAKIVKCLLDNHSTGTVQINAGDKIIVHRYKGNLAFFTHKGLELQMDRKELNNYFGVIKRL